MQLFEEFINAEKCDVISKLFFSRDVLHIFHLRTKSYASHIASQGYYEAIVGLVDSFIEELQGETLTPFEFTVCPIGIIEDEQTLISYLQNLNDSIKSEKELFSSALQNILDEISTLITQTIYKLEFLK